MGNDEAIAVACRSFHEITRNLSLVLIERIKRDNLTSEERKNPKIQAAREAYEKFQRMQAEKNDPVR